MLGSIMLLSCKDSRQRSFAGDGGARLGHLVGKASSEVRQARTVEGDKRHESHDRGEGDIMNRD